MDPIDVICVVVFSEFLLVYPNVPVLQCKVSLEVPVYPYDALCVAAVVSEFFLV